VKERGVLAAYEVPGEPNAISHVELAERPGGACGGGSGSGGGSGEYGLARYRLVPATGQTHQLRVHMNTLGVPILGDPLYPVVADPGPAGDFRRPLQLLARVLEFTDPVTGVEHRFRSGRVLEAWASYDGWAAGQ
jgi:tRNA pseudouridine32 synthase / 23S rRNA pseudouridine746 synthase